MYKVTFQYAISAKKTTSTTYLAYSINYKRKQQVPHQQNTSLSMLYPSLVPIHIRRTLSHEWSGFTKHLLYWTRRSSTFELNLLRLLELFAHRLKGLGFLWLGLDSVKQQYSPWHGTAVLPTCPKNAKNVHESLARSEKWEKSTKS